MMLREWEITKFFKLGDRAKKLKRVENPGLLSGSSVADACFAVLLEQALQQESHDDLLKIGWEAHDTAWRSGENASTSNWFDVAMVGTGKQCLTIPAAKLPPETTAFMLKRLGGVRTIDRVKTSHSIIAADTTVAALWSEFVWICPDHRGMKDAIIRNLMDANRIIERMEEVWLDEIALLRPRILDQEDSVIPADVVEMWIEDLTLRRVVTRETRHSLAEQIHNIKLAHLLRRLLGDVW